MSYSLKRNRQQWQQKTSLLRGRNLEQGQTGKRSRMRERERVREQGKEQAEKRNTHIIHALAILTMQDKTKWVSGKNFHFSLSYFSQTCHWFWSRWRWTSYSWARCTAHWLGALLCWICRKDSYRGEATRLHTGRDVRLTHPVIVCCDMPGYCLAVCHVFTSRYLCCWRVDETRWPWRLTHVQRVPSSCVLRDCESALCFGFLSHTKLRPLSALYSQLTIY